MSQYNSGWRRESGYERIGVLDTSAPMYLFLLLISSIATISLYTSDMLRAMYSATLIWFALLLSVLAYLWQVVHNKSDNNEVTYIHMLLGEMESLGPMRP